MVIFDLDDLGAPPQFLKTNENSVSIVDEKQG